METKLYRANELTPVVFPEITANVSEEAAASAIIEIETGKPGEHVDILAAGPGFRIYAIFDFQGARNIQAEAACSVLTGESFGEDEDTELRGPIVIFQL